MKPEPIDSRVIEQLASVKNVDKLIAIATNVGTSAIIRSEALDALVTLVDHAEGSDIILVLEPLAEESRARIAKGQPIPIN